MNAYIDGHSAIGFGDSSSNGNNCIGIGIISTGMISGYYVYAASLQVASLFFGQGSIYPEAAIVF